MKPSKLPISALIITRNEENFIARALDSLEFAEEIIVVDGGSTDKTIEIAKSKNAQVHQRAWTGFADQRNHSLSLAKNDWVFVLDADEAATPELEKWLRHFFSDLKKNASSNGYKIHRTEYFLGNEISGACWNPSIQDRFFLKDKANYVGEIHEYPEVEGGLVCAPDYARILHNPHITVESFFEKMNRYTTVEAWDRYQLGERTNLLHMFVTFFSTWAKNYFYYSAYRDGTRGFVISVMEAVSRTVRHIKLWQIQAMKKAGRSDLLLSPEQSIENGASMHRKLESELRL